MSRAFVFPGQGAQALGMGRDLAQAWPEARAVFDEVDEALGERLSAVIWGEDEDALRLTANAQPALMATSMAAMRALAAEGVGVEAAAYVAGHSLGEYSALAAAGALGMADAARLLRRRGEAMQAAVPVGEGAMAAILGLDLEAVRRIAQEAAQGEIVQVANDNDPAQVVVSGARGAVERAAAMAPEHGAKRAVMLPVSAPFHCSLMAPAAREMADALDDVDIARPRVPLVLQRARRGGGRSGHDPLASGRSGDGHGALARERRLDGAARRDRAVGDRGRKGADGHGPAHRPRAVGARRRHGRRGARRGGEPVMFDLSGKRALVTGASGGIGGAVARALHGAGAAVALSGTRRDPLEELAGVLGERAHVLPCDLSDADAVEALPKRAAEAMGGVDVLVNNAGITRDQLLMRMADEDWAQVLDVNLGAAMRLSRGALRGMMRARWGRIVNVTSVVGVTGNPGQANYAAAKAGLVAMGKSLAAEVATRGVTVNAVAPGFVGTAMTEKLGEEQRGTLLSRIPMGRMGTPEEVAAAVLYLASQEAGYVTGATLHVNGGMAML